LADPEHGFSILNAALSQVTGFEIVFRSVRDQPNEFQIGCLQEILEAADEFTPQWDGWDETVTLT
jgi:hypothetical protein